MGEAQSPSGWQDLGHPISGETGIYEFIDNDPPAGRNFYRLEITPTQLPAADSTEAMASKNGVLTVDVAPKFAEGCKGCSLGH